MKTACVTEDEVKRGRLSIPVLPVLISCFLIEWRQWGDWCPHLFECISNRPHQASRFNFTILAFTVTVNTRRKDLLTVYSDANICIWETGFVFFWPFTRCLLRYDSGHCFISARETRREQQTTRVRCHLKQPTGSTHRWVHNNKHSHCVKAFSAYRQISRSCFSFEGFRVVVDRLRHSPLAVVFSLRANHKAI